QWIDTPYEIPSLRSYAKSYLDGRGWDGSLLDDLSNFNLQPFESVHIPESCLTAPCNSIALPTDSIQYGYPGLTLSNKSASGSAWVDAQVEHCAANPTISFPQSRLNAVQATDLRASTDFALQKNMSVGCDRRDCRRVCFIFCGTICLSYPGICTLEFSATGHVDVGKNMPLAKAAANDWRTVAENLANVNYSFTWYAKLVGGVNQSQGNSYFNQTVEALRNQLVTTGREIGRGMGESFRSAVNNAGIHDPVFNEDNCFVTTNPQDTVVFQPANGTGGIPLISTISLTFSEAILPHSLQVSTTHDCTGNVLLSSDNFATCHPFSTTAAQMSNENKTATVTP
ncbi:MAG TPA: Ig-like domain-containing protein, partial [Turneriella sp.]|nr:Ig-like domain-containing protein [Turneriella sp.]